MKHFKLEKFLLFFQLESGAEVVGYFGLVIGWLLVIADVLELTGSLECTQRLLNVCQVSKIGKLLDGRYYELIYKLYNTFKSIPTGAYSTLFFYAIPMIITFFMLAISSKQVKKS